MSYCLYKHRSRPIVIIINTINRISTFHTFAPSFLVSFSFYQLDLLANDSTSKVVMVHASPPSICHLARGGAPHRRPVMPLIAIGPDKTRQSGLVNRTIQFAQLRAGASGSCSFCVQTHFGDSVGKLTTPSTSRMKGGNSGHNGSDLDKGNILKPTFDILTDEGRKAFEAYHANLE
jgi:hypothetical protein